MDTQYLAEAVTRAGVLPAAVQDALARAGTHFGATDPDRTTIDVWCTRLKTAAPHFFAGPAPAAPSVADIPAWLSPAERITRARALAPPPPRKRPGPFVPSADQLKELAGLSLTEKMTRWRAMRDAQQS